MFTVARLTQDPLVTPLLELLDLEGKCMGWWPLSLERVKKFFRFAGRFCLDEVNPSCAPLCIKRLYPGKAVSTEDTSARASAEVKAGSPSLPSVDAINGDISHDSKCAHHMAEVLKAQVSKLVDGVYLCPKEGLPDVFMDVGQSSNLEEAKEPEVIMIDDD
ncbi:hypothetical protein CYMTET_27320 [Cymbomonas tetramitiformis]|uniref:Uncharacterized protein n=1 Tax=Cymbomonas tetramitiformis TaxID=36881 RepID=A0AAE0FQH2_9CHLO|nr:hypothetical protein CYMTET_27320 [Cymbomonas tetramitiformis]